MHAIPFRQDLNRFIRFSFNWIKMYFRVVGDAIQHGLKDYGILPSTFVLVAFASYRYGLGPSPTAEIREFVTGFWFPLSIIVAGILLGSGIIASYRLHVTGGRANCPDAWLHSFGDRVSAKPSAVIVTDSIYVTPPNGTLRLLEGRYWIYLEFKILNASPFTIQFDSVIGNVTYVARNPEGPPTVIGAPELNAFQHMRDDTGARQIHFVVRCPIEQPLARRVQAMADEYPPKHDAWFEVAGMKVLFKLAELNTTTEIRFPSVHVSRVMRTNDGKIPGEP